MTGRDLEYAAKWASSRPHVPMPVIEASVSSISLQQLVDEKAWAVKRGDSMFVDADAPLCGFILPHFQRPAVWSEAQSRRFVESAWLGIHLGTIVWNDATDEATVDGRFHYTSYWLLDGQQRLTALARYRADGFAVFVGTPHEHRWSDLNLSEVRKFHSIQIGSSRIATSDEYRLMEVYDLLNFGGTAHDDDQRALPVPDPK